MFFRARRALHRSWFDFNVRGVLATSPLAPADTDVTVASMLCHADLRMYLLAVKSLIRRMDRTPHVVVLNDGSLTDEDTALLKRHIPSIRFVPIASIQRGRCPKGGAWELLLMMSELVQSSYVVQVDSDTLTPGPIPEVNGCLERDQNFVLLGDRSYPHAEPMLEACARSQGNLHPHVQALCERSFDQLPEAADLKYLRGNAGFLGFRKGSFDRDRVEWFSDLMRRIAKDKWNEWGSEQVTTNLLMANSPDPLALPFPRYCSYWAHPEVNYRESSFVHFIGPHRYSHGMYVRTARAVMQALG